MKENIFLDDLVCLYDCVDFRLRQIQVGCMPDTMKDYFNQLNRLLSIIHSDILEIRKDDRQRK